MKKTTVKKTTVSKTRAIKKPVAAKTVTKAKTTTVKRKPAAKKSVASAAAKAKPVVKSAAKKVAPTKKGLHHKIKHHAKKLYKLTPKFVHGMIVGGLVGLLTVTALGIPLVDSGSSSAASGCDAHGIGNRTLTHSTNNSAYSISGSKVTVVFDVVGKNCHLPVTMVVWKAPNGTTGKPYSAQTIYKYYRGTFTTGRHSITGELPPCYFQVDTVTGTSLVGSSGGAHDYDSRQVAFMHGGTTTCTPPTPTPPTPPAPSQVSVCDTQATPPAVVNIDKTKLSDSRYTQDLTKCVPPKQPVCIIATGEQTTIEQKDFDSSLYSTDIANCHPPTPTTPTTPSTPDTPTPVTPVAQTLPNTGPGAVIVIALMAVAGGFIFHKYHHHKQSKRRGHYA